MAAALASSRSCTAQFDLTMVYVTHDQTEALTFADKVVVMYEGEVVQIGTPEELFERPAHTFVGYFIGSPGHERRAGRAVAGTGRALGDAGDAAVAELTASLPAAPGSSSAFGRNSSSSSGNGRGLPGRVVRVDDVGRYRVVKLDLEGHLLQRDRGRGRGDHGRHANIVFDPVARPHLRRRPARRGQSHGGGSR